MRRALVVGLVLALGACSSPDSQGGDVRAGDDVRDTDPAEGLFGDWGSDHDGTTTLPDGAVVDVADGSPSDVPVVPGDAVGDAPGEATPEVVVPITWDVLVLTAVNGQLYRNGQPELRVQRTTDSPFVAIDGELTRFYTLTENGQGRIDGDPAFEVAGVPAGVLFIDLAASFTPGGTNVFTLQSNGQVRNNGGHMLTLAPPSGQAWAALAAEGAEFYLATSSGTLFQKGQLYTQLTIPVPGGDSLVGLRVLSGQFYALTQGGRVYKNTVLVHDLSAKAAPPFVGFDTNGEHVWAVTRSCTVLEDGNVTTTLTPFSGDTCAGLALVHSQN